MSHPLVSQLRFTRREFKRALEGLSDPDARQRFLPMNCISWIIGHLAWQEQRYFLELMQGDVLLPELNEKFCYGCSAHTPLLEDMWKAWHIVTKATDPFLDTLTTTKFKAPIVADDKSRANYTAGSSMLRVIYHYWHHTGESMAIRQMLGNANLPEFVGSIDLEAPYEPH